MSVLRGQTALITGASGAIGGAIARELAKHGAELLLCGRDRQRLESLAGAVRGEASRVEVLVADLAEDEGLSEAAHAAANHFDGVDLLIHSLGLFIGGKVEDSPVEELDLLYRVNLRSPYQLTRLLLPSLKERQGQIVFMNSSAGTGADRPNYSGYAAAKSGLTALTNALRGEINAHGVRVLAVYPGRTASAMQAEVHRFEGRSYDPARWLQPEDVAAATVHALTLPRTAEVTDLHIRPMLP
ncbi:MAG: SDR family NAD(P)-dependent oxidoreductase [Acidobacteria bacterium]|nr:SDR family NAD(P)-dependent oxidoreductase [Acidobacteriota bacterium]